LRNKIIWHIYFCNQCKKEVEILKEKTDEYGHPFKVLSCGHETPREVKVSDNGRGKDVITIVKNLKYEIRQVWDSLSFTLISVLITVALTVGFGVGSLTKNPCFSIICAVLSVILIIIFLKFFKNFLIKITKWILGKNKNNERK